jgi:hypothetical protein
MSPYRTGFTRCTGNLSLPIETLITFFDFRGLLLASLNHLAQASIPTWLAARRAIAWIGRIIRACVCALNCPAQNKSVE